MTSLSFQIPIIPEPRFKDPDLEAWAHRVKDALNMLGNEFTARTQYGSLLLTIAGKPATMSNVSTTPVLVDIFNLVAAQSSDENAENGIVATLSPTYAFTIGIDGLYHIEFWASFSCSSNNTLVTFTPFKNAAAGIVEVDRFLATGADTGVVGFNGLISYAAGDVADMRVNLDAGTADLTFLAAGLNIHRVA